jgi:hypothetical protein
MRMKLSTENQQKFLSKEIKNIPLSEKIQGGCRCPFEWIRKSKKCKH